MNETHQPTPTNNDDEQRRQASQRVGIYRTNTAAERARDMLLSNGIPSEQVSLLAPENPAGVQLATRRVTRAPRAAWVGMLTGVLLGGLTGSVLGQGSMSFAGMPIASGSHIVAGLVLAFVFGLVGAATGAVLGSQRAAYRTSFRREAAPDAGAALGVVTTTKDQDQFASYTLESTGAIDVHQEPARVLPRACPDMASKGAA